MEQTGCKLTKDEMIKRGWSTWYHPNYWVHRKTIADPTRQDYTNYGFSFEDAVRYELGEINEGRPFIAGFFGLRV